MMSDKKNKGTLFSSTLKIGEKKVHLFSWLEVILVSYDNYVVFPFLGQNGNLPPPRGGVK